MYRTIVVGTDGSETANVAVSHATQLAKLTGAKLHIVHGHQLVSMGHLAMAASAPGWSGDVEDVNAQIATESEAVCAQAAEAARRVGVEVETHSRPGDPAEALLSVAEETGADLLVVGNRGMTGVRRFVLGSVPNKVSHHCPCSLLIVDTSKPPAGGA
jgi:nucleotide-binding universal stress UspA family protein